MQLNKNDINQLNRIERLKIINSITGIKPGNLIGTTSDEGVSNLAVFSSVVHLGSNPSLLGFVSRPRSKNAGHTLRNIKQNGVYTINHIHPGHVEKAHYTSVKFPENTSEFDACGFSEEYLNDFKAPFVKESNFKIGMCLKEVIEIKLNGTVLVIGEVNKIIMPDNTFVDDDIDLEASCSVGISGLNTYYSLKKINKYPYARLSEIPQF